MTYRTANDAGQVVIVVLGKPGQLGNRLFLLANFVAFSAEHGISISGLGFDDFANSFEGTRRDIFSRHPRQDNFTPPRIVRRALYSGVYRLASLASRFRLPGVATVSLPDIWADAVDMSDAAFLHRVRRSRLLFTDGWLFHDRPALARHKSTIRRFLCPRPSLLRRSERVVEAARRSGDVLVGVHIRRGDYASFLGGKYFYDLSDYVRWVEQAKELFPNKRASFLVSSDEDTRSAFAGNDDVFYCEGHPVADLYALALCDFLVGPPSTFSMWASYYGSVPLFMTSDRDSRLDLAGFSVARSQMDFPDVAARHQNRAV